MGQKAIIRNHSGNSKNFIYIYIYILSETFSNNQHLWTPGAFTNYSVSGIHQTRIRVIHHQAVTGGCVKLVKLTPRVVGNRHVITETRWENTLEIRLGVQPRSNRFSKRRSECTKPRGTEYTEPPSWMALIRWNTQIDEGLYDRSLEIPLYVICTTSMRITNVQYMNV